jgi:hypothetical protein
VVWFCFSVSGGWWPPRAAPRARCPRERDMALRARAIWLTPPHTRTHTHGHGHTPCSIARLPWLPGEQATPRDGHWQAFTDAGGPWPAGAYIHPPCSSPAGAVVPASASGGDEPCRPGRAGGIVRVRRGARHWPSPGVGRSMGSMPEGNETCAGVRHTTGEKATTIGTGFPIRRPASHGMHRTHRPYA